MQQEIELKLVLCTAAADSFSRSALLPCDPVRRKLHALYFDTPEHALYHAGISLRIRRSGRKRIQTIKSANAQATGLYARSEWEIPVADNQLQLDGDTPVTDLLGKTVTALSPIFEIKVERSIWMMDEQNTVIEMVLDQGTAIADKRRSAICEIELELKQGDPAKIFTLARKISDFLPVRLGVITKADRGYELLGPEHPVFKAEKVPLPAETSLAGVFQSLAGACIRHYRRNEDLLISGEQSEAVHQARVALRRLRSAIAIFKPMLAGESMDHFKGELRWLTGVFGGARDLDVMLDKVPVGTFHDRLRKARNEAYVQLIDALESRRVRSLFLDLTEWITVGPWLHLPGRQDTRDLPAADFAAKALHKLRKRVKKRGKALETLNDDERHELRKAAKRLRYGVEFFGPLFPAEKSARRFRTFAASLEQLQDDLGALNDLVAMPEIAGRHDLREELARADLPAHRKKAEILCDAAGDFNDLMDLKTFWSS